MNKKAMSFVEVIIAMSLLLIAVCPIINLNVKLMNYLAKSNKIEEDIRLNREIVTLIKTQEFNTLKEKMGKHNYYIGEENNELVLYPQENMSEIIPDKIKGEVEIDLDEVKVNGEPTGMLVAKMNFKGENKEKISEEFLSKYGSKKWE